MEAMKAAGLIRILKDPNKPHGRAERIGMNNRVLDRKPLHG